MTCVWRLLVVCVLVIAMPLQGVAAGSMLLCGLPAGAPLVQPSASGASAVAASHAGGDHGTAHTHHRAVSHTDSHHTDGHHNDHNSNSNSDTRGHTCSVCATCCLGQALPSTALDLAAPEPVQSFASAPRLTLSSIVVDGLERPPRLLPA